MGKHYLEQEFIERLQSDPELFQWLEAGSLDGVWYWDIENPEAEWYSPQFWRTLGYDPATREHRSSEWQALIHPEDLELAMRNFELHCEDPSHPYDQIVRYRHQDGSTVWIRCRGYAIRDPSGRPIRFLGAHNDVTPMRRALEDLEHSNRALRQEIERREQEMGERLALERKLQQTQKLESLGVLAGGIAHDFNNLLVGLLGYADLALMELPMTSPARPNVEQVIAGARQAAELARQMLAYSGKGRFVTTTIDVSTLVEEMVHLFTVTLPKKAVVRYDLARALPTVEADPSQIRQVVMNLVLNAGDAVQSTSGMITVATGALYLSAEYLAEVWSFEDLEPGTYVYVEVSDTGMGMDAQTVSRIFEPLFSTKGAGRGLGLAAVQGIARGHGGAIKVYSEKGRGTTIKFLLPCLESEPRGEENPDLRPGANRVVLVVDDEDTVRAVARKALEYAGYRVLVAGDGKEAVEIFRARMHEIDVVLLDMTMPRMDGVETYQQMREIRPGVPTLLTSGYNEQDATHRFAGKGLAGFIQKPWSASELLRAISVLHEGAEKS